MMEEVFVFEVRPTGSKVWRYRYRLQGKSKTLTLGTYPDLSLKEARDKYKTLSLYVTKGLNPIFDHEDIQTKPKDYWSDIAK